MRINNTVKNLKVTLKSTEKINLYENNISEVDKIEEQDIVKNTIEDKEILIEIDKDFKYNTVHTVEEIKVENKVSRLKLCCFVKRFSL